MRVLNDDSREVTLVSILNDGEVPFKRIIPNNDNAFVLEHRVLHEKKQIVLFRTPRSEKLFKMFIYDNDTKSIVKSIEYNEMNNTWSYFNTLCNTLNKINLDKNEPWKTPKKKPTDW